MEEDLERLGGQEEKEDTEESKRAEAEVATEGVEETEEDILATKEAVESLASLGLSPEESQMVPDYDGTIKIFNEGDVVTGTVVKVDKEEVLLDIGYKSEGVIPARELSIRHDVKPSEVVSPGDELEALVLQKEDKEGRLILSKKRAQYERAWEKIEKVKAEEGVVEGEVIEVVKGGLILDIGLRGFLPASLVEMRRVKDLNQFLGQKLEAKIIELDKNRNNVVLSRRAHLEKQKSTERKEFLEQLEKGTKRKGTVSSIVNFGAFVDLGGVDGLIHISELSWSHVDHPSEVLSVNDEVEVEILDVDLERERVSLSLKKAQEDPWEKLSKDKPAGSTVHGRITKLVPFGAFMEIAPGVEGLIHISELAWEHIEFPEEIVAVDEEMDAKIIDIDLDRRRISLSLKQLTGPGESDYEVREENREEESEPDLVEASEFKEGLAESSEQEAESVSSADVASEALEIAAEVGKIEEGVSRVEVETPQADAPAEEVEQQDASDVDVAPETEATSVGELEQVPASATEGEEKEDEPDVGTEEETAKQERGPVEEGSLESILADMKKKGQQE